MQRPGVENFDNVTLSVSFKEIILGGLVMLDFAEIKKVRIVDIIARYGIRLRFKGEWASAPCPLPSHKTGDKGRNFTINLPQNYWRCFSQSCNENNAGKKGGDVINFVALMENCRERDAAQKIAEWHALSKNLTSAQKPKNNSPESINGSSSNSLTKTAQHIAERPERSVSTPHKDSSENNKPSDSGKGYIKAVDAWFDDLFGLTPEKAQEEYWKKARNEVKSKLIESFKNGKAAATVSR